MRRYLRGKFRFAAIEGVREQPAKERSEYRATGQLELGLWIFRPGWWLGRRYRCASAHRDRNLFERCGYAGAMRNRIEETCEAVAATKGMGNPDPASSDTENREQHERKQ